MVDVATYPQEKLYLDVGRERCDGTGVEILYCLVSLLPMLQESDLGALALGVGKCQEDSLDIHVLVAYR